MTASSPERRSPYYVSFDNTLVGKFQGQYLVNHLAAGSTVAMINGDQTSAPGVQFKQGLSLRLNPAFNSGKLKLGYTIDTRTVRSGDGTDDGAGADAS